MTILLNEGWTLTRVNGDETARFDVPGDVHSSLLAANLIPDPYWRDTETDLDWVHEAEWVIGRDFTLDSVAPGRHVLTLAGVDCVADVRVNGVEVGRCENQFLRYDFDVDQVLIDGENRLEIEFLSNSKVARAKAEASPIPVPNSKNCRIGSTNFLRKTACHAGWDWNIALCPVGVHSEVNLRALTDGVRLDEVKVLQHHESDVVRLEVVVYCHVLAMVETSINVAIDGQQLRKVITLYPGESETSLTLRIDDPRLWWPVGHGQQEQYDLTVTCGGEQRQLRIGLRAVSLVTDEDSVGSRFALKINDREIFTRGANWIPADALPARGTREAVRDLLVSAVEANMNMIRVWGGGQYEADWFYELCSELGLMVWQDFMFACNLYPAADRDWLALVRREARQQVRRLSSHPCLTLWCGDNELVGALGWFEESTRDRDRYLALYDRLNHALDEIVHDEKPGIPFWPSSPSVGPLNFGDGWHDDRSGDMHFWDVWHESKDFEHYRSVRPRFCSEFGFQSFPSMRVIESFTEPVDRNVSSAVMDVHQRNVGGNSRIVETMARYFRFPERFEDMCYLSQVSQGLAMQTAIEFWRSSKPRCMGTLYWQLNDTWPVASWSSLEYGGGWKLVHYLARRFFAPVLVTAQPDASNDSIVVSVVCDLPEPLEMTVQVRVVDVTGGINSLGEFGITCDPIRALEITRVARNEVASTAFIHMSWRSADGRISGEGDYLPERPKNYVFPEPVIKLERHQSRSGDVEIELSSDTPVLYVTYDHGGDSVYSDNCFTLLPGIKKRLKVIRKRQSHLPHKDPQLHYLKS